MRPTGRYGPRGRDGPQEVVEQDMSTTRYILRRLIIVIPQMALISVITFVLIRMLPGDPARLELGPLAPQEGVDALREELRLDESIPSQYAAYVERLLNGDLGRS
jgi:peptide/nickel transport system permease protein